VTLSPSPRPVFGVTVIAGIGSANVIEARADPAPVVPMMHSVDVESQVPVPIAPVRTTKEVGGIVPSAVVVPSTVPALSQVT
jgi:hypothetical protein